MCEQYRRTALKPFLNGTKNGDVDGMCKRSLSYEQKVVDFRQNRSLSYNVWDLLPSVGGMRFAEWQWSSPKSPKP